MRQPTAKRQADRSVLTVAWRAALVAALVAATLLTPTVTAHAAALPDGRAYELVSPPVKFGDDVVAESSRTRAAALEAPGLPMAVAFASLGGFADVIGMGISTEYVAQRSGQLGTSGWTTHAVTPPQDPLSLRAASQGLDPLYEGDFSADLARGVFRAWSPLTDEANVAAVANLYVRTDLRTAGAGSFELLTSAATLLAPIEFGTQRPYLAGTSRDVEHAIFESRLALTPDAAAGNVMLYKADRGVVRLLAPGPACPGASAPAVPCSVAGTGASALKQTSRAISADGSRVVFASPVTDRGSPSMSVAAPSTLYQFDDRGTAAGGDDVTLHVNASEKHPPDAPQPALFQSASRDGERVLFTSGEQLTDTPGAGLYVWRRTPAGGGTGGHLTLIGGDADARVVGASDDGRRVYFAAPMQLVPSGPPISENGLFLWRDDGGEDGGTLSFVGAISFADTDANANLLPWNQTPGVTRVTPDGSELLFEVSDGSGLTPGADHGTCTGKNPNGASSRRCSELYLYRAERSTPLAPDVVCVSCDPSGVAATANALINVHDGSGASQVTWHLSRALADDGRRVFFSTAQALVRGDVNGRSDAYEYDVASGTVQLISSGRSDADSWFLDASESGDDVFFVTRERLVGWDVDASYDLYDARVGGGFPDPVAADAPCSGEGCRGAGHGAPEVVGLGSVGLHGGGDAGAGRGRGRAHRCRRGFAKRRLHGRRRCARRKRRR